MRRRLIRMAFILLLFPPFLAALAGWLVGPAYLHPIRRELTPDLIREADASFALSGGHREDFNVRAPDGVMLRGWKVSAPQPNGSWVLLFHGVADNRVGVIGQSEFLLRAGYGVVMMDARAHGASEGPIATYGWLERNGTRAIIDELVRSEIGRYAGSNSDPEGGNSNPPQTPICKSRTAPAFPSRGLLSTSSRSANPWAPASRCNPPRPTRASKRSPPKRPSQVFAKPLMITPDCAGRRCSEKRFSRPSVGRFSIAENLSRDSTPPKSPRKNPWPREPSLSFSSATKRMSRFPAATR